MIRLILAVAASLALSACGNVSYMMTEYKGVKVVHHHAPEMEVRIFDRPDHGRLMVTPTVARAAALGAGSGITLGIWTPGMDPFPMQAAAQHWLNSTGRNATITSGKLLAKPQWEFTYSERR